MVFTQNFQPKMRRANIMRTAFMTKKVSDTGIWKPQYRIEATPVIPPVVISLGRKNSTRPTEPMSMAMLIMT